jgi:toxin FitB
MVGHACTGNSATQNTSAVGGIQKEPDRTSSGAGKARTAHQTGSERKETGWAMPLLRYLADTNVISDALRGHSSILEWLNQHSGQVGISTFTLAEMRRGIELKQDSKARRELERDFRFVLEDYRGAIFVFDEAAAMEWGRLMAEARNHPLPYQDSLLAAIARSHGLKMLTRNIRHFKGCVTVDPSTGVEHAAWPPRS